VPCCHPKWYSRKAAKYSSFFGYINTLRRCGREENKCWVGKWNACRLYIWCHLHLESYASYFLNRGENWDINRLSALPKVTHGYEKIKPGIKAHIIKCQYHFPPYPIPSGTEKQSILYIAYFRKSVHHALSNRCLLILTTAFLYPKLKTFLGHRSCFQHFCIPSALSRVSLLETWGCWINVDIEKNEIELKE
jgi:hypothetical protein